MSLKKIILLMIITLNTLSADDETQRILNVTWNKDISKRFCSESCGNDKECKRAKNLCDIMVKLPLSTIDKEAFMKTLKITSSAISGILDFAVKKNIIKLKDVLPIYNSIYKAFPHKLPSQKIFDLGGIAEFAIDTVIDVGIEYSINNMSSELLQRYRSIDYIVHDNASDDDIRQGLKWMMKLAKNDAKAFLFAQLGNPLKVIEAGVIDNAFLLADIGIKVTGSGFEAVDATIQAQYSKKRSLIADLYAKHSQLYYRAFTKIDKAKKLANYSKECNAISLTGLTSFLASIKRDKNSLVNLNNSLRSKCNTDEQYMKEIESKKNYILYQDIMAQDEENFGDHLEYFYPKHKFSYGWRIFNNPKKFDFKTFALYGEDYQKQIERALLYGLKIDDFNIPYAYEHSSRITKNTAYTLAIKADVKYDFNRNGKVDYSINAYTKKEYNIALTRKDFASFLCIMYGLPDKYYLFAWQKYNIEILEKRKSVKDNGWTYFGLVLNQLEIIEGDPSIIKFRPNSNLTIKEAVQMIVNAMSLSVSRNRHIPL